jgi:EpsI family protein
MRDRRLLTNCWVTILLLAGATVLLNGGSQRRTVPIHDPLRVIPEVIGEWHGSDVPLEPRIVAAAGVDDYLNRLYTAPGGREASIYIGYYNSQRTGDLIHSPRNCLPASGWETVRSTRLSVDLPGRGKASINDFVIARGLQRNLVFYWYQERGRVIPGEYMAKFWMVADALVQNRTDGALVRIVAPIRTDDSAARRDAVAFLRAIFPSLEKMVPE